MIDDHSLMTLAHSSQASWRPRPLALGVVSLLSFAVGCASLAGLSGGGDAGDDAHTPATKDAAPDVSIRVVLPDAGVHDATVDGKGADVHVGAGDAHGDASVRDAVPDVPCAPADVSSLPNFACPVIEAGACGPRTLPNDTYTYHPPRQMLGSCTAPQVTALLDACFAETSTPTGCTAYQNDPTTANCFACMYSDYMAPEYGAIIGAPNVVYTNQGGCIALADPCNEECGQAYESLSLCQVASCSVGCFPATPPAEAGVLAAYDLCTDNSKNCSCQAPNSLAGSCYVALHDKPKTSGCFGTASFTVGIEEIASLFCISGSFGDGGK